MRGVRGNSDQGRRDAYETPVEEPLLLAQEGNIFIVSKPAGLPVHPGTPGVPSLKDWIGANISMDVAPVHRLDAPVSGLVLCAEGPDERRRLSKFFEERMLTKTYLALVHGRTRKKGIIRRPLKDPRRQRQLDAVTRYGLAEWVGPCSLLRVRPETGRKHQIRRHLKMIGHGIVGDQRYRSHEVIEVPIDRLWLHAYRLELPDGSVYTCPLTSRLDVHLERLRSLNSTP